MVETVSTNVQHAFFIAIILGTSATKGSIYAILVVDFALNILSAMKIVKFHKNISSELQTSKMIQEKQLELLTLVLTELIEVLTPLVYISSLLIALYGPNSAILGNYGNDYWQYKKIEHLDHILFSALELFLIDLFSCVLGGVILWKLCSVNVLQEICKHLQAYWTFLSARLATALSTVSILFSYDRLICAST